MLTLLAIVLVALVTLATAWAVTFWLDMGFFWAIWMVPQCIEGGFHLIEVILQALANCDS